MYVSAVVTRMSRQGPVPSPVHVDSGRDDSDEGVQEDDDDDPDDEDADDEVQLPAARHVMRSYMN